MLLCQGECGLRKDRAKACDLWLQAAESGGTKAYHNIGNSYLRGNGVEQDTKKANHYYMLAAMGGTDMPRHNLGCIEEEAGNYSRALKHYMIAAGFGLVLSVEAVQRMYMNGNVTKDDYLKALRVYQAYVVEIKSPQRDEAAKFSNRYIYHVNTGKEHFELHGAQYP